MIFINFLLFTEFESQNGNTYVLDKQFENFLTGLYLQTKEGVFLCFSHSIKCTVYSHCNLGRGKYGSINRIFCTVIYHPSQ